MDPFSALTLLIYSLAKKAVPSVIRHVAASSAKAVVRKIQKKPSHDRE